MDTLVELLVGAVIALFRSVPRRQFERELEQLARELGGNFFLDQIHLQYDGAAIRITYVRRGNRQLTELEVDLPRGYPFALYGSPDQLEGAPRAVVSRLFDAPLRELLNREGSAELATPGAFVRLSLARPFRNAADARQLVAAMARLPARLRDGYAEAAIAEHEGGPYREDPSGSHERELHAAWADEVEQLIARRTLRR